MRGRWRWAGDGYEAAIGGRVWRVVPVDRGRIRWSITVDGQTLTRGKRPRTWSSSAAALTVAAVAASSGEW